jgi:hypothetical protein
MHNCLKVDRTSCRAGIRVRVYKEIKDRNECSSLAKRVAKIGEQVEGASRIFLLPSTTTDMDTPPLNYSLLVLSYLLDSGEIPLSMSRRY